MNKASLVILSGPTGVGKSTLKETLVKERGFEFSISATTRSPRPGEKDGVDYHFVSEDYFSRLVEDNAFIEWARFANGKRYGTLAESVIDGLQQDKRLALDIDVQGHAQIRAFHHDLLQRSLLSIFVLPPSIAALRERLLKRGSMSPEEMEKRLTAAPKEMLRALEYHEQIVNDNREVARLDLLRIVDRHLSI